MNYALLYGNGQPGIFLKVIQQAKRFHPKCSVLINYLKYWITDRVSVSAHWTAHKKTFSLCQNMGVKDELSRHNNVLVPDKMLGSTLTCAGQEEANVTPTGKDAPCAFGLTTQIDWYVIKSIMVFLTFLFFSLPFQDCGLLSYEFIFYPLKWWRNEVLYFLLPYI